jgi:hypothetical protein
LVAIVKAATFVAPRAGQIGAKGPAPIRPAVPHDKSAVNESVGQGEKIVRRQGCRVTCAAASQRVIIVVGVPGPTAARAALPPVVRERRQKTPSRSGGVPTLPDGRGL